MSTDYLAEAITEAFGERCPDYAEGCHACEAWKQYDAQASDLHTLRAAIFGSDNYDHTLPVSYFVEMLKAERRRQFDAGYTLAVANLIHLHDQPGMAADVMAQTGITITDINRMGLTDYDLKPLRKMFREEPSLRPVRRARQNGAA